MREVSLPSGATLMVDSAPFSQARALWHAVLGELKAVPITSGATDTGNALKDLLCGAFSSPAVDRALKPCLIRSTYNGQKITDETFEPVEARADYVSVCLEVAKDNVLPFGSGLYAVYLQALTAVLAAGRGPKSETMTSSSISDSVSPATPAP